MPRPSVLPLRGLAALATLLGLIACGGAPGKPGLSPARAPRPAADTVTPAIDYEAIVQARTDSARRLWTEADAHFMTTMIGHHAQAIVMSDFAPTNTSDPAIRTLAARIINAQRDEIARMQRWLRDRDLPVPDPYDTTAAMAHGAHGAHHGHDGATQEGATMPGMLTAAELEQLAEARGADFDRLFLASMIRHHRGAVTMVEELFGSYGAGQDEEVFRLATDINVDQITEINRMEGMLLERLIEGGTP